MAAEELIDSLVVEPTAVELASARARRGHAAGRCHSAHALVCAGTSTRARTRRADIQGGRREQVVTLTNRGGTPVAFKFKSNAPGQLYVRPNGGVLRAGAFTRVVIALQPAAPPDGAEPSRPKAQYAKLVVLSVQLDANGVDDERHRAAQVRFSLRIAFRARLIARACTDSSRDHAQRRCVPTARPVAHGRADSRVRAPMLPE